ncbi:MAG: MBG domain-containing protein, partial [Candidatus Paceibacterota bacterium]
MTKKSKSFAFFAILIISAVLVLGSFVSDSAGAAGAVATSTTQTLPDTEAPIGSPTTQGAPIDIWISPIATGKAELGTEASPYVADTSTKFDQLMRSFSYSWGSRAINNLENKVIFHLLPGTFKTAGQAQFLSSAHPRYANRVTWEFHDNWTLQGAGADKTFIELDSTVWANPSEDLDIFIIMGEGRAYNQEVPARFENQFVKDLTIDGNFSQIIGGFKNNNKKIRISGLSIYGDHSSVENIRATDFGSNYSDWESFPVMISGAQADTAPNNYVFDAGCQGSECSHITNSVYYGSVDPNATSQITVFTITGSYNGNPYDRSRVDNFREYAYLTGNRVELADSKTPINSISQAWLTKTGDGFLGGEGNYVQGYTLYNVKKGLVQNNSTLNASAGYYTDFWSQSNIDIINNKFERARNGVVLQTAPAANFNHTNYNISNNTITTIPSQDGARAAIRIRRAVFDSEPFTFYPPAETIAPRFIKNIKISGNSIMLASDPSGPVANTGIMAQEVEGLTVTDNILDSRFRTAMGWPDPAVITNRAFEFSPVERKDGSGNVIASYPTTITAKSGNKDEKGVTYDTVVVAADAPWGISAYAQAWYGPLGRNFFGNNVIASGMKYNFDLTQTAVNNLDQSGNLITAITGNVISTASQKTNLNLSAPSIPPFVPPIPSREIWIDDRTDGLPGTGTQKDPYDGSTAEKFDSILRNFSLARQTNLAVHLMEGTFHTRGIYNDILFGTVPFNVGWASFSGWNIEGAGMGKTSLEMVYPYLLQGDGYNHIVGSIPGSTNQHISDLTINCNLPRDNTIDTINGVSFGGDSSRIERVRAINCGGGIREGFVLSIASNDAHDSNDNYILDNVVENSFGKWSTAINLFHSNATWVNDTRTSGVMAGNIVRNAHSAEGASVAYGLGGIRNVVIYNNYAEAVDGGVIHDTANGEGAVIRNNRFVNLNNFGFNIGGGWLFKGYKITDNLITLKSPSTGVLFNGGRVEDAVVERNVIDFVNSANPIPFPGMVSTPPATVNISLDKSLAYVGSGVRITWTATNASSCYAYGGWSGPKSATGGTEDSVTLNTDTTFKIVCLNQVGRSVMAQVVVSVVPRPDEVPPVITTVPSADPIVSVTTDEEATCKYDIFPGKSYDSMTYAFTDSQDKKTHSAVLGVLAVGTNNYYIRCRDLAVTPNDNLQDYIISFVLRPNFGFSLNLDGDRTITKGEGSEVSNLVTVTKNDSVDTRAVALNISGLPENSEYSLGPCTPNPTCTSLLSVVLPTDVTPGNYEVTITGLVLDLAPVTSKFNLKVEAPSIIPATISLTNFKQTYNGQDKAISYETNPPGKEVSVVYSPINPKNAGTYAVTATIIDPAYQGETTGELTVEKADQTITFDGIGSKKTTDTFSVTPFARSTAGLPVSFSVVSGPANVADGVVSFSGAGDVTIRASQAGNENYKAAVDADQTFNVGKKVAVITLTNLNQTYTRDEVKSASFTTADPISAQNVSYVYHRINYLIDAIKLLPTIETDPTSPVEAGTYQVVATVNHPDYEGQVIDQLNIAKADQTVTFNQVLSGRQVGDKINLIAESTSGLSVSFEVVDGPATLNGNELSLNGAQAVTVVSRQSGDSNYRDATDVSKTFSVGKAPASVVINDGQDLVFTYGTQDKSIPVVTTPTGKRIVLTYSQENPTNAGTYSVTATIDDSNY